MAEITEKRIGRISQALLLGVSITDLHTQLLEEGYSEYDIFLLIKAGEVNNKMFEKTYIPNKKDRYK